MFVIKESGTEILSSPAVQIKPEDAKSISSDLAIKILKLLSDNAMYPIELAKQLKVHEQKIYYHIRNLEAAGIIKVVKEEGRQGAIARYYKLDKPSVVINIKDLQPTQKMFQIKSESEFFDPFIKDGKLDALIIVGSPDPHGPDKARSRDGYYGMDLALFIGTFLNYVPNSYVRLDTEVRTEELQNNLILIGGPVVNKITEKVNDKLPVYFDRNLNWAIKSKITNSSYPADEAGIIVKTKNPFNPDKMVLVVAGKRYSGTRASMIAFLKHYKEISKGNLHNPKKHAKIVEGIDLDSDGIVDEVEIRE